MGGARGTQKKVGGAEGSGAPFCRPSCVLRRIIDRERFRKGREEMERKQKGRKKKRYGMELFIHFFHLANILLSTYCVPGTVLDTSDHLCL